MPTPLSRSPRTGVVWDAVVGVIDPTAGADHAHAPPVLSIVDVGGGTGGFAVPLATLGHQVTVVDPSPDALASLERRAREEGVQVRAVQGDAAGLLDAVAAESADLVLCHGVLEHVDDVAPALSSLARALRPGGTLSVLAANRNAAVLARAVAGHFAEARHALDDPAGRWGPGDPLPRRFTEEQLVDLLTRSGLSVRAVHGVRGFSDLAPRGQVDSDPGAAEALRDLETATADRPDFRTLATQLHLLAGKA
jgi:S-adenosylmethionine-dependent methyltransferase